MSLKLFFLLFLSLLPDSVLSDPRDTEAALICDTNNTASMDQRRPFITNFSATLEAVSPLIARQKFATVINGTGNTTVYTFGECMKDLSQDDCNLCFARLKTQILRCLPFQRAVRGGRLFYDGCYLRYDSYNFFNESLSGQDRTVCSTGDFSGNRTIFRDNVLKLVRNLSVETPNNDGFFVGSVTRGNTSVYGLAQCWEFVTGAACEKCLASSVQNVTSCAPKKEGRILNAGCYLRYSTKKFYHNSTCASGQGNGGNHPLGVILAATSAGLALLLTIAAVIFFLRKRVLRKRQEKKQLGALLDTVNKSKLNISYEVLEKATNYFHDSNKLGQGGSGSVYKGVLPDGKVVAVKRLFFNTRQWVDHFFNEVNLISGIRHKNLVELLGCSITGPESLLVYEYVPNQSLHDNLFALKNVRQLRWDSRYKIILGVAEGLAYLHEESNLRIIHRDIKLGNIMLDEDLTPKIADFGLARLFPEDKTHISTAIAGTLGYMAPEYIVRGKLSEKADVYSFGILVLEVVCGRKNNPFNQNSNSILPMVWSHYGTGTLSEAVDPSLRGNFEAEEASRLLQIGLLSVQASAELRPSMSAVVNLLTENHEIPQPTQPPFLNSSSTEIGRGIPSKEYYSSKHESNTQSTGNNMTESWVEPR
ncbi:cysteine-rich receptor-like protein kinase 3 isoform X2 [Humulus lupulus]|uniref:cysteine-rich receptor-like protein kinase 3 isoform X2 n=1 Tax=Humulus lupulus TaxID=3486 RepID=UPI002B40DC07|nr:cysteine-rich receptor-like protein kinase 3 isoform X2 [Humulus lupulus]